MSDAMRLLYVESTLAVHGGIERVLTDKLNWLVEYGGCDVCLLIANQGEKPFVFSLSTKVKYYDLGIVFHQIFCYPLWKRYFRLLQLRLLFRQRVSEKIKDFSPDIIVCTRLECISDVMQVRRGTPVVYEAHNSFLAYKYEHYSLLQRVQIRFWHKALKNVDMIVALNQGDALEWKKLNSQVRVIPNVVHLNESGIYSDCSNKCAIFVGRFSYQKDLQSLINIWELVYYRHPDWILHIYGSSVNSDYELPLMCEGVVIHAPTCNIFEEYLKNSMLLLTSHFEPFGLVLPEAMSCGLPVVAFDCPYGPSDIITDGKDGFIIKDRSITEYADKVCQLIENYELRCNMGKAGILSSQKYAASRIMPQWIDLFMQLCIKNKQN